MNARVKTRTRSYTCRVTRACQRIRITRVSRLVPFAHRAFRCGVSIKYILFYSIRALDVFAHRRVVDARVRHHEKSIQLFRIYSFTRTSSTSSSRYAPVPRLRDIYFFHLRRPSSVVGRLRRHPRRGLEPRVVESRHPPDAPARRPPPLAFRRRSFSPVRLTRRGRFHTRLWRGYLSVPHSSVRCARSPIDAIGAIGGRRNVSSATDRTVGVFFVFVSC